MVEKKFTPDFHSKPKEDYEKGALEIDEDNDIEKPLLKGEVVIPKCMTIKTDAKVIDTALYSRLVYLGIIGDEKTRGHNVGESNYAKHTIQPWSIFLDYPELSYWDNDILKRTLRTKTTDSRRMDYEKIMHICQERIRQIDAQ